MYVCLLLASRLVQHKSCFCENHANFEAVRMVRDLARKQHSRELAQPAARIASVTRSRSAVPLFFKIRGSITNVIATLEARVKDGEDDRDRDGDLQIVQASTKPAKFKAEISTLQCACWMAGSQAKMDQLGT